MARCISIVLMAAEGRFLAEQEISSLYRALSNVQSIHTDDIEGGAVDVREKTSDVVEKRGPLRFRIWFGKITDSEKTTPLAQPSNSIHLLPPCS